MKKFVIFIIAIMSFSILQANPVGNPGYPSFIENGMVLSPSLKMGFRFGYLGDFVLDRNLKICDKFQPIEIGPISRYRPSNFRVNKFSEYINSMIFTFTVLNRLDLYVTCGKGKIKTDWIVNDGGPIQNLDADLHYLELESKYKWSWMVGGRVVLFEWGKVSLSAGASYKSLEPHILSIIRDGVPIFEDGMFVVVDNRLVTSEQKISYHEWQTDLGIAYKIELFSPYIAIKYSAAKSEIEIADYFQPIGSQKSHEVNMKSKNHFGMAVGCGISNGKYFGLNCEVRMIDEEAFTVTGEFKF
jgi:major outer membrane protein